MTGDGLKMVHFGPKIAKHGRLVNVPKWSKRVQKVPKWPTQVFLTIWDPFGTIWIRFIQVSYVPSLRLFLVILFSLQVQVLTYFSHYTVTFCFTITRSFAALLAADLDWIIGPEYSLGGYIFGEEGGREGINKNVTYPGSQLTF